MDKFKRPESVPYPRTYVEFQSKNNKKLQYWVQDLTEEYVDGVIGYLKGFLSEEPMHKSLNSINDPECVAELGEIWRFVLNFKMSLVCLAKDGDGNIEIAGYNILSPFENKKNLIPINNEKIIKCVAAVKHIEKRRNIFEEFNCNVYLSSLALYVLPKFRGEGLGEKILKARDQVAQSLGFLVGMTFFSSPISAKQAARAGFKDFVVAKFADIKKENEYLDFPGIEKDSLEGKLMYKLYE